MARVMRSGPLIQFAPDAIRVEIACGDFHPTPVRRPIGRATHQKPPLLITTTWVPGTASAFHFGK